MTWRSRPTAAIAAVAGLLISAGLAVSAPAIAAQVPTSAHAAARVPAAKVRPWRISDPADFRRAIRTKNWVYTPEGLAYKSCVNHVPVGGRISKAHDIISRSGAVKHVTPCTLPTLAYPASAKVTAQAPAAPAPAATTKPPFASGSNGSSCEAGAPSWWAETCTEDPASLVFLSERFSIPSDPQKSGGLFFFFPSFEDATGADILQPVLTWGANAGFTGVTNPDIWYITSWYGDQGTYFVGPSAHVQAGGTVTGEIQRGLCAEINSACEYIVTTSDGSASVSVVWPSGPAMTQVDGGVMESQRASGCVETPASGHVAFRNLVVRDPHGTFTPGFQHYTPFPECSVKATPSGSNTDITWAVPPA